MAKKTQTNSQPAVLQGTEVQSVCIECQAKYTANKTAAGVISPPRCPVCQTAHLTNLRVNKTIKDLSLLGNLKNRLSDEQRKAVINAVKTAFISLADRYAGTTQQKASFDLKRI